MPWVCVWVCALGDPHSSASSAFFAAGGHCCISRRQDDTYCALSHFMEQLIPAVWCIGNTISLAAVIEFAFRATKLHTFQVINCMCSSVSTTLRNLVYSRYLWSFQGICGFFKVKLTSIEKVISDWKVCLRTLLKWGFDALIMHLSMTFTSILQDCSYLNQKQTYKKQINWDYRRKTGIWGSFCQAI